MECAHHAGRQAVATCNRCGKGLCSECADRVYSVPDPFKKTESACDGGTGSRQGKAGR